MALSREIKLKLIEKRRQQLQQAPQQPPTPEPGGFRQAVTGAARQVAQRLPGVQAGQAFAQAPEPVQRGILTGGGAAVGQFAGGPIGAAGGAALGGTAADILQEPEKARQILQPVGEALFAASPFGKISQAPEKALAAFQALQEINPTEAGKFAKKRAIESLTAATFGLVSKFASLGEASGPFTAALKNPKLIFTATRQKAFDTLKGMKDFLVGSESPREVGRLSKALASPERTADLANEAMALIKQKLPISGAQLLAFREALKTVRRGGGFLAGRADTALQIVKKRLEVLVPGLQKQFKLVSDTFSALAKLPASSFIPGGGTVGKAARAVGAFPGVKRVAGATVRAGAEALPGIGGGALGGLMSLLEQRRQQ